MNKFIRNIIFFTSLIISIFTLLTFFTEKGLRKSEFGNLKEWNAIFNKDIHADVLIQGSSRAWVQFNTYIIDSILQARSYNMGMDGSPFDVQYVRYKAYIENNKFPKVIIQNVDYETIETNQPVFQKYQFLPFLNNAGFEKQLLNNNIIPTKDSYLPFLKYAGQPKAIQVGLSEYLGWQHFVSKKHNGYAATDATWNGLHFKDKIVSEKQKWSINKDVEKLFLDFILDCQHKKIRVILVYAPVYYELPNLYSNFNDSRNYFKLIAKKYQLSFLDYSITPISSHLEYFKNATHLNKKGSEVFTMQLAKELRAKHIIR